MAERDDGQVGERVGPGAVKRLRGGVARLIRLGGAAAALLAPGPVSSWGYLRRFVAWSPSGIDDWRRFPARPMARAPAPFRYPEAPALAAGLDEALRTVTWTLAGATRTAPLDALLEESGTTAFVVVKDGQLLRERYLGGHTRDTPCRAFSVTKSVTSMLVGLAIEEGRLGGLDDTLVRWVPELAGRGCDGITLRHLLEMSAGLRFTDGRFPWKDSPLLYWHPDLRRVLLAGPPLVAPPGERFGYSDYASLLLAMVLERATGTSLSRTLEARIWQRIGAEYDASWSLDQAGSGLELAHAGLNARAIDLVKLGTLYLDGGRWGAEQVVPARWVDESVRRPATDRPGLGAREADQGLFYGLGWWGQALPAGGSSFFAHGYQGQLLYACPARRIVVARFGRSTGGVGDGWPALFRAIVDQVP